MKKKAYNRYTKNKGKRIKIITKNHQITKDKNERKIDHGRLWKAVFDKWMNLTSCRTVFYCAAALPEK